MRNFWILGVLIFPVFGLAHGGKTHTIGVDKKVESEIDESADQQKVYQKINESYLSEVKPIFKASCFDCHSDKTNYPWYHKLPVVKQIIDSDIKEAREHLDFSKDFPFAGHETPEKDLKGILDTLKKGEMPLWSYEIMHPNSKLTEENKRIIYEWIDKSLKELKQ